MTATSLGTRRRRVLVSYLYRPLSALSGACFALVTDSTRKLKLDLNSLCTTIAPFWIVTRCALPLGHSESKLSQVLKC